MKKVFIIDDDAFLTKLYTTLLQNEGICVGVAHSGADAIAQLPAFNPDLVVLDLHMPDVTGVEIMRFLRGNGQFSHLPVIVLSSGYTQTLVEDMDGLNVQKFFSKLACKPRELVDEIKALLAEPEKEMPVAESGSSLEAAIAHIPAEGTDQLHIWLRRLHLDSRPEARRVCLIHIYKIMRSTLLHSMDSGATTPCAKLSRALIQLLEDLYDHPGHVTETTMQILEQSLQKLFNFCAKDSEPQLSSEAALRNILSELDKESPH